MTYPEYVEANEYRERLLKLVNAGRKALPAHGFALFADSVLSKVKQLEAEMSSFEKSSSASMCSWLGLRTFNVTAQLAARNTEAEVNVLWNSPSRITSTLPATIQPSQSTLSSEDNESGLLLQPESVPA